MKLSIITSAWNLSIGTLYPGLWQLSHQTEPPLEIIIVNSSPDAETRYAVQTMCDEFPLVRCIEAVQDVKVFNLSRSSNVGIKHSSPESEWISVLSAGQLYSPTSIAALAECVGLEFVCETPLGSLPATYDLGDIETLWDRWADLRAHLFSDPPAYSFSPGSWSCIRRDWLFEVHGYDEETFSFSYGDSDLLSRAAASGIGVKIVPWSEMQMIHIEHPARFGIQCAAPTGQEGVLIRNPEKWGEIDG